MISQEHCFPEAAAAGTGVAENKNTAKIYNEHSRVIIQDLNTAKRYDFC